MQDTIEKRIELAAPVSRVWNALTDFRQFSNQLPVSRIHGIRMRPTLVEFRLEEIAGGTLLVVTESGFDKLPKERYDDACRMNNRGWEQQLENIQAYVGKAA